MKKLSGGTIALISAVVIFGIILGYVNFSIKDQEDTNNVKNVNGSAKTQAEVETDKETAKYPFREMLTYAQQSMYDQIYENVTNMKDSFKVSSTLDTGSIPTVITAIYNDHPELFWVDTSCKYQYQTNGTVGFIKLFFNDTINGFSISKSKFDSTVNEIIEQASGLANDLEKEKYVYKHLIDLISYDESAPMNQSAYSAIVNGKSVCAGYARAFQYIMMQLEIPCYLCDGDVEGGSHGWNIVKIDGKYYNVDLTWDDTISESSNKISYKYFNVSDSIILKDHTRGELSANLPSCN